MNFIRNLMLYILIFVECENYALTKTNLFQLIDKKMTDFTWN